MFFGNQVAFSDSRPDALLLHFKQKLEGGIKLKSFHAGSQLFGLLTSPLIFRPGRIISQMHARHQISLKGQEKLIPFLVGIHTRGNLQRVV